METIKDSQSRVTQNDAIALAAYLDWISEGKPFGRDQEFWAKAEARLKNGGEHSPAQSTRTSKKLAKAKR